jgi:hypothetical protein
MRNRPGGQFGTGGNSHFRRKRSCARVMPSSVTNGLADSCATITARQLERFVVAGVGRGGMLHQRAIVPDRFSGVGAWHALRNSAVFWSARPTIGIHGNINAVVFPGISDDGYFDHTGGVVKSAAWVNERSAPTCCRQAPIFQDFSYFVDIYRLLASIVPRHSNAPQQQAYSLFNAAV